MARRLTALIVTALAMFAIASTATAHGATVFYTACDAVSDTDTVKVKKIEEDGSGGAMAHLEVVHLLVGVRLTYF